MFHSATKQLKNADFFCMFEAPKRLFTLSHFLINVNLALINIKQLVTVFSHGARTKTGAAMRDLGILKDACVLTEDSRIAWVGEMKNLTMSSLKEATVIDCTNKVAMPGFVDSHTHALFAGSREDEFAQRAGGLSYQEIASKGGGILSTIQHVRGTSKKEL
jgi:imidazolonepropionase